MSMLGNIFDRIFRRGDKSQDATVASTPGTAGASSSPGAPTQSAPAAGGSPATANATAPQQQQQVDIEAVMTDLAARNSQKLNWRTSIVDLLKLLDLDSSLQARKDLADELGYSGDKGDSAAMNIWLHKQVMRKVAENGGKVPADLRD